MVCMCWTVILIVTKGIDYYYAWQLTQTSESSIICTELEGDSFSTVYCIAFTAGLVRR